MSEKGILCRSQQVRAIMTGYMTQTHRCHIKPQPEFEAGHWYWKKTAWGEDRIQISDLSPVDLLPYQVGDLLWVKETLFTNYNETATDVGLASYKLDGALVEPYLAWRWKTGTLSSRFMPKEAARLWLRVTGVRVELLHDITEEDARKEGYTWADNPWIAVYEFERVAV